LDSSSLPQLPVGWIWVKLDQVADITGGITKGKKHASDTKLRKIPYLRVANVQRGFLDLSEMKTIAATEQDIQKLTLIVGDILFNEGGDRNKLGRGWVWEGKIPECIHQNHVFRARLLLTKLLQKAKIC
jgi:type I restriction enzyme S subunit